MKKFIKKLVPILLVILIIASLAWYCFVFDRNFTRDILLAQARVFSTNGNQKLASWFYDTAYLHSGQDDDVAIELANQFKAEGNYTKAEYTLTNAIADGGSPGLYIALCKTYVEQNKLLDAVNMLDNIQDIVMKNHLDNERPAAPVSDPEPGFYSQYISVSLSCPTGTIYYTTNGEYPSTDDIPYSDPIQLSAGETTIMAVSVDDNGLVSPLSVLNFTIGGVIEEITFEDPVIEAAVREILKLDEEAPLMSNDLWTITSLTVPENVTIFEDLAKLPYLQSLTIEGYRINTLHFLTQLSELEELVIRKCRFSPDEFSIIASLPKLKALTIAECGISTILGLENAANLEHLDLSDNTLRNLEPLSGMLLLKNLNLSNNAVTGLSALGSLVNLEKLDVSYNSITSMVPVATMVKLAWLDISHNSLSTLSSLDNLPNLTHFSASHNGISDVSLLGTCVNLVELDISNNQIANIDSLSALAKMELLDFAHNQVVEFPAWPEDSALRTIDGSYNKLTSVYRLKDLMELSHLYLDYNELTEISYLASCYKLVMVNIYGNSVSGVDKLTERSIIVNYNPMA